MMWINKKNLLPYVFLFAIGRDNNCETLFLRKHSHQYDLTKRAQYVMGKNCKYVGLETYSTSNIIWPTWPDKGQAQHYPSNKKSEGEELKRLFLCTLDFTCLYLFSDYSYPGASSSHCPFYLDIILLITLAFITLDYTTLIT